MSSALHSAQLARQLLAGLQAGPSVPPAAAALTANHGFLLEAGVTLHRRAPPPRPAHPGFRLPRHAGRHAVR